MPVPTGSFDFAFSNSLFTHLLPGDAVHYLTEISRALKKGGRALNTMFLLNDDSEKALADPSSPHGATFPFAGDARVRDPADPERWIAFDERAIMKAHESAGLSVTFVRYGRWCGRTRYGPGFGSKDIVVAGRTQSHPVSARLRATGGLLAFRLPKPLRRALSSLSRGGRA